jgi:hypothetical protein
MKKASAIKVNLLISFLTSLLIKINFKYFITAGEYLGKDNYNSSQGNKTNTGENSKTYQNEKELSNTVIKNKIKNKNKN